jgi:hypothetical protein
MLRSLGIAVNRSLCSQDWSLRAESPTVVIIHRSDQLTDNPRGFPRGTWASGVELNVGSAELVGVNLRPGLGQPAARQVPAHREDKQRPTELSKN